MVLPLIFPKVPPSSLTNPHGSPVTPSPWTPPQCHHPNGGPGAETVESLSDVDDEELEGYLLDAEEIFFWKNGYDLGSTFMGI